MSTTLTQPHRAGCVLPGHLPGVVCVSLVDRYTLLSWIPKGTFEQFRRVANVYFLGISILMIVGTYTTFYENSIQYYTTLGPLIVIIGFTLVKEGLEDKKRHESDAKVSLGANMRRSWLERTAFSWKFRLSSLGTV